MGECKGSLPAVEQAAHDPEPQPLRSVDSVCASVYVGVHGCMCVLRSHGSSYLVGLHVLTNDGGI